MSIHSFIHSFIQKEAYLLIYKEILYINYPLRYTSCSGLFLQFNQSQLDLVHPRFLGILFFHYKRMDTTSTTTGRGMYRIRAITGGSKSIGGGNGRGIEEDLKYGTILVSYHLLG